MHLLLRKVNLIPRIKHQIEFHLMYVYAFAFMQHSCYEWNNKWSAK